MSDGAQPRAQVSASDASGEGDVLDALRSRLEELDETALDDRPDVFESINETLVGELGALEDL